MTTPLTFSKYRWRYIAGVTVTLTALWLAVRWWEGPSVAAESVMRRDFVQTVVASGHVENPHRVEVGAQITGTVVRVPVEEGQTVKAHDVLVELATEELKAAEQQADLAVAQAQAKLRQIQEVQAPVAEQTLRQAQVNLDNARANLKRNEDLFAKNFIGEAALEDLRKSVALADAQLRSAQKQLDTTRPGGSDYAMAQSAVTQAQATAEVAHARAQYAWITAPSDGVLITRNVEVGDVVQPGKVLMTLSPHGRSQLVLSIDEKNLRLIALGQKALASADAYPQQKFPAELVYINPGVNVQTGAVDVKLDIPQPPAYLRQDMTVSVDIEVARRPHALLITTAALHDADSAAPWVLRLAGGRLERVVVHVGLRGGGMAEVLSGLQEGDTVVAGPVALQPGARAHAKAASR